MGIFEYHYFFPLRNTGKLVWLFEYGSVSLYWKRFNNKLIFSLSISTIPRVIK